MTDEAMSPLRRRMIEDMTIRKLAPKTQHGYMQQGQELRCVPRRDRPIRRASRTCAATSCIWRRAALACRPSITPSRRCGSFSGSRSSAHDIVEHTAFHPRAAQAAGRAQPGGGGAAARCRAGPQIQGGAERGLRRRIARRRGGLAQGLRHRQQAHGHPGRAGQRPQRPLRDAVAASARPAARLVEGGAARRAGCFPGAIRCSR